MNSTTKAKVTENSPEIYRHIIQGTTPEYNTKRSQNTVVLIRAVEILRVICQRPMTAYEIARILKLNSQTVFQYLGGMEDGGVPIVRKAGPIIADTGRPETLFSLEFKASASVVDSDSLEVK